MSDDPQAPVYSPLRKAMAWSVHLFTAMGAVCGLMSIRAVFYADWREAFFWMGVAVFVDGMDGTLARLVRVKEILPDFDGTLLDNVIDYQNYVIVPALLVYWMELVPARVPLMPIDVSMVVAAMMALSSAFQFCQGDAKTHDHYFKGFPSYWNIVVFYLAILQLDAWLNLAIILTLCIMVFIPLRYIYPTRTRFLQRTTLVATSLWGAVMLAILYLYPDQPWWLVWTSLLFVAYYITASMAINLRRWTQQREANAAG